jgi:uncharacterized protein YndB with AHSA1/START domain
VTATEQVAANAHVDWLPHVHFVLDHPVREVWPHLVHWEEWIAGYECEHVSGPVDAPGEKKRITFWQDESGSTTGHFFAEIVRLEPERRLVYRLLPLPADEQLPGVQFARGHEIFNVYELTADRTLVTYETVAELESSTMDEGAFTALYTEQEADASPRWLDHYVPELERRLGEKD